MDRQPTSGRGIAVKTFLIISLLVIAVPLTYILFPFGSMTIAKATSLDFLFLLLMMAPNLLLALWTGFFLGPRLSSVGYLRSVGWQLMCAVIWAAIFGVWIFVVLFHRECLQVIAGKYSFVALFKTFSVRIVEVVATNCLLLIPITLIASGITLFFSHRKSAAA